MDDNVILKYFTDLSQSVIMSPDETVKTLIEIEDVNTELVKSLSNNVEFWDTIYYLWQDEKINGKVTSKLSVDHCGDRAANIKTSKLIDETISLFAPAEFSYDINALLSLRLRRSFYSEVFNKIKKYFNEEQSLLLQKLEDLNTKLIKSNLRLVVTFAKPYRNKGVDFLDLIQEGNFGLLQAIDKFNPASGTRFSTYARWWVRQACIKAIKSQNRIHIPAHIQDKLLKAKKDGREDSNLSTELYERLLGISSTPISLEAPIAINESDIDEGLAGILFNDDQLLPDDELQQKELSTALLNEINKLDETSKNVIILRTGLLGHAVHTHVEVGDALGFSKETARKLEVAALIKLRTSALEKFI